MKNFSLKVARTLVLCGIALMAIYSCKMSPIPPDPNEGIVGKRELIVSALDVFTKDSISQFNVTIVSPTATSSQITTGKTFVIKDVVAGTYKITVTKTGYADPEALSISVVVPTDPKVSLSLPASVLMTKAATPVTVTGTTGAVIAVKTNSTDANSAPVAAVSVAPGTVFTLADGTKPATVAISASNIPLAADNAPIASIGGVNTAVIDKPIEVVNGQVASQKIDLQPSGLVLSQPMTIDMYIGDDYPPTMSLAEKTARQAGLTLNYVRKDGTVEVVTPDRFSSDRNTVYYKISHFSQWSQTDSNISFVEEKAVTLTPIQTVSSPACGGGLAYTFTVSFSYPSNIGYKFTRRSQPIAWASKQEAKLEAKTGYIGKIVCQFIANTYILTDKTPGFASTTKITTVSDGQTVRSFSYVVCHNQ